VNEIEALLDRAGEILAADACWVAYAPFDLSNPRFQWRAVKLLTGGGIIMDTGVHFAVIRFKSGPVVRWTYSRAYPGAKLMFGRYYVTMGTVEDNGLSFHALQGGGTLKLADGTELSNDDVVTCYRASLTEEQEARLFPYGCEDALGIQTWEFCQGIRNGHAPEVDAEAGLKAKALSEACYESATAGEPVLYDDVVSGKVCAYQKPIDEYWGL
jgi:predicted dehydrogenase